jgi:predicted MFS family arabinose efflux permease
MLRLQDVSCNCVVDWRNWFVLVYSSAMILLALIIPFFAATGNSQKRKNTTKSAIWQIILFALVLASMILNIYALYSYTRDLEESQCNCITASKDATLFGFVYYYIRISLILLVCSMILTGIMYISK